jgi:hypothetical protein
VEIRRVIIFTQHISAAAITCVLTPNNLDELGTIYKHFHWAQKVVMTAPSKQTYSLSELHICHDVLL